MGREVGIEERKGRRERKDEWKKGGNAREEGRKEGRKEGRMDGWKEGRKEGKRKKEIFW